METISKAEHFLTGKLISRTINLASSWSQWYLLGIKLIPFFRSGFSNFETPAKIELSELFFGRLKGYVDFFCHFLLLYCMITDSRKWQCVLFLIPRSFHDGGARWDHLGDFLESPERNWNMVSIWRPSFWSVIYSPSKLITIWLSLCCHISCRNLKKVSTLVAMSPKHSATKWPPYREQQKWWNLRKKWK
jgi:hypothetical protein